MVTPPSTSGSPLSTSSSVRSGCNRRRVENGEQELSASPELKKNKALLQMMKRTPQPALTQSKLTAMFQSNSGNKQPLPADALPDGSGGRAPTNDVNGQTECMDVTPAPPNPPNSLTAGAGPAPAITIDILMNALKENRDFIIKSVNSNINALSRRIDANVSDIASNTTAIAAHEKKLESQKTDLVRLEERVRSIEKGNAVPSARTHTKAVLSQDYILARRSVRLWPVTGSSEEEMWEGVGEFIHDVLMVSTRGVGQDDIESIRRPQGPAPPGTGDRKEVIVTFYDKWKRDTVVASSPNLSEMIDQAGRPTAGVRLEIPEELEDTFRMLNRFGTRLRARHGAGTKRHIKFDDFTGSLFTNIKLPGDDKWSRITADMAREDLQASLQEENNCTKKRLATKLVPGPKERLQRPPLLSLRAEPARTGTRRAAEEAPSGKRPRWSKPGEVRRPV